MPPTLIIGAHSAAANKMRMPRPLEEAPILRGLVQAAYPLGQRGFAGSRPTALIAFSAIEKSIARQGARNLGTWLTALQTGPGWEDAPFLTCCWPKCTSGNLRGGGEPGLARGWAGALRPSPE